MKISENKTLSKGQKARQALQAGWSLRGKPKFFPQSNYWASWVYGLRAKLEHWISTGQNFWKLEVPRSFWLKSHAPDSLIINWICSFRKRKIKTPKQWLFKRTSSALRADGYKYVLRAANSTASKAAICSTSQHAGNPNTLFAFKTNQCCFGNLLFKTFLIFFLSLQFSFS